MRNREWCTFSSATGMGRGIILHFARLFAMRFCGARIGSSQRRIANEDWTLQHHLSRHVVSGGGTAVGEAHGRRKKVRQKSQEMRREAPTAHPAVGARGIDREG